MEGSWLECIMFWMVVHENGPEQPWNCWKSSCKILEVKLAFNDTRKQKDKDTGNFLYPCPHLGCSAEVTDNWMISNWKEEGKSPVSLHFLGVFSDSRESDLKQHAKAGGAGLFTCSSHSNWQKRNVIVFLVLPLIGFTYPDAAGL